MKILVTGGAGFLGQAICRGLQAQGHTVVSTQRRRSAELDAMGVEQRLGDLADAAHVQRALEGVEAVFHNAAKAGHWGSEQSYIDANVTGTTNVLDACRAHGISRLVYTSTPSVAHNGRVPCEGGNEVNTPYAPSFKAPYPRTKQIAEKAVLAANGSPVAGGGTLSTVALRPRLIWGPGDTNLLPRLVERARFVDLHRAYLDHRLVEGGTPGAVAAQQAFQVEFDCDAARPVFRSQELLFERLLDALQAPAQRELLEPERLF
jgi:nucleoside-diphosphate-sugar epimerase